MNEVFHFLRARRLRAELLAFGLGLMLATFSWAAQGADGVPGARAKAAPTDPAAAKEIARRTRALERARGAVVGVQAVAIEDAGSVAT